MRIPRVVLLRACVVLLAFAAPTALAATVRADAAASPADVALVRANGLVVLAVRIDGAGMKGVNGTWMPGLAGKNDGGLREKVVTVTVTNEGAVAARGVRLRAAGWVDREAVVPASVDFCPSPSMVPMSRHSDGSGMLVEIDGECDVPDILPGRSARLDATVRVEVTAVGAIGEIRAVVSYTGQEAAAATTATLVGADHVPRLPVTGRPVVRLGIAGIGVALLGALLVLAGRFRRSGSLRP